MAIDLDLLLSELKALREEVATLKTSSPKASPRRGSAGASRRIVGEYFADARGIMAFQNQLLDWNHEGFLREDPEGEEWVKGAGDEMVPASRYHFDDQHLCMILNAEYANRDCWAITPGLMKTIRRLHNEGKHGKDDVAPVTPIPEYTE